MSCVERGYEPGCFSWGFYCCTKTCEEADRSVRLKTAQVNITPIEGGGIHVRCGARTNTITLLAAAISFVAFAYFGGTGFERIRGSCNENILHDATDSSAEIVFGIAGGVIPVIMECFAAVVEGIYEQCIDEGENRVIHDNIREVNEIFDELYEDHLPV